jgi:phage/plasmid-like protein (TIGR03299 family)
MAHELSEVFDAATGRNVVEAMYANRPAWHNLGQIFGLAGQQAPDSTTAAELAHLNWRVEKEPMNLAADGRPVNDFYALVRQDTRDTLNVVGNKYHVLQNADGFSFLDSLQQDGLIRYESAFALKGGRSVVLLARMPSVDYITREDGTLRYVACVMMHGDGSTVFTPTATRIVCANTLRVAISAANRDRTSLTIRHTGSISGKLDTARHYLAQFDKAFTDYRDAAQSLLKGYSAADAAQFIDALFPAPAAEATDRIKNAWLKKIADVRATFFSPAQNLPTVKGTWWALFNAVTETVDHAKPARQASDLRARQENAFVRTILADGADLKAKAFDLALTLSA